VGRHETPFRLGKEIGTAGDAGDENGGKKTPRPMTFGIVAKSAATP